MKLILLPIKIDYHELYKFIVCDAKQRMHVTSMYTMSKKYI